MGAGRGHNPSLVLIVTQVDVTNIEMLLRGIRSARAYAIVSGLGVCSLGVVGAARAQPNVVLESSERCPFPEAFIHELEALVGPTTWAESRDALRLRIASDRPHRHGFSLERRAANPLEPVEAREVVDRDCAALLRAALVVSALTIAAAHREAPPPEAPPAEAPPALRAVQTVSVAKPQGTDPEVPKLDESPWYVGIGAGAALAGGFTPGFSWLTNLALTVRGKSWLSGIGMALVPPQVDELEAGASLRTWMLAGQARVGGVLLRLGRFETALLAAGTAGRLQARAHGLRAPRSDGGPWLSAGLGLYLTTHLGSHLSLSALAQLDRAFTRAQTRLDDGRLLFRTPVWVPVLGVQLEWTVQPWQ